MYRRYRLSTLLRIALPMLAATTIVSGQGTPDKPQTTNPQAAQGATFRAAANYVSEDVKPKDAQQRFVSNLKKEEFEIYEDGVRQTVETFIPYIGGRAMGSVAA